MVENEVKETLRARKWERNLEETKLYYLKNYTLRQDELDDILLRLKHGENMYAIGKLYVPHLSESQQYTFIHNIKTRFGKFMEFPDRQRNRKLKDVKSMKAESCSSELIQSLNDQGRLMMIEELEEFLKNAKKKLRV